VENGEVVSFFAWINGQQRTREEWRGLSEKKEELRKIIQPYASESYPDIVHDMVNETSLDGLNCWP
jgi:hypothetical protein